MNARTNTSSHDGCNVSGLLALADRCAVLKTALELADPGEEFPQVAAVLRQHLKGLRRLRQELAPVAPERQVTLATIAELVEEVQRLESALAGLAGERPSPTPKTQPLGRSWAMGARPYAGPT